MSKRLLGATGRLFPSLMEGSPFLQLNMFLVNVASVTFSDPQW